MTEFVFRTPWRVARNDARISLVDADGIVVTEIIPGQIRGAQPTLEDLMKLGNRIATAVNGGIDVVGE